MKKDQSPVIAMRLPEDIKQQLQRIAAEQSRTMAGQILHYVKAGLANEGEKK